MRKLFRSSRRSGFTLVEVMLVIFMLALAAIILGVTFPSGHISRMKAVHMTDAISMASQTIEQLKAGGYANANVSDTGDVPLTSLPSGTQRTIITQYSPSVKKVDVTIRWAGYRKVGGHVELVTFISDHG